MSHEYIYPNVDYNFKHSQTQDYLHTSS